MNSFEWMTEKKRAEYEGVKEEQEETNRIGFYNIGWTEVYLSGQNIEMHSNQLGKDCAVSFATHSSSEVGAQCFAGKATRRT